MGETAGGEIGAGVITPLAKVHENHEFPVSLEARTDRIFSSFNIAPRAVMLLLARETPVDQESFYNSFKTLLAGSDLENIDGTTISHYCSSLVKAGLLRTAQNGISLTPDGAKYGQPLAAMFVDFERTQELSLYPVFVHRGDEKSSRPYLNRAKILEQLSNGAKTEVDLSRELRLDPSTIEHGVNALKDFGVVAGFSPSRQAEREEQKVTYQVVEGIAVSQINLPSNNRRFYEEVIKACLVLAHDRLPITREKVFSMIPDAIKRKRQEKFLKANIASALPYLASQGFLEKTTLPEASLTTKGKVIVDMIVDPLQDALGDGLTLENLRTKVLPKVLNDLSGYARVTADLYYPHSYGFRVRQSGAGQERVRRILSITPPSGRTWSYYC